MPTQTLGIRRQSPPGLVLVESPIPPCLQRKGPQASLPEPSHSPAGQRELSPSALCFSAVVPAQTLSPSQPSSTFQAHSLRGGAEAEVGGPTVKGAKTTALAALCSLRSSWGTGVEGKSPQAHRFWLPQPHPLPQPGFSQPR